MPTSEAFGHRSVREVRIFGSVPETLKCQPPKLGMEQGCPHTKNRPF